MIIVYSSINTSFIFIHTYTTIVLQITTLTIVNFNQFAKMARICLLLVVVVVVFLVCLQAQATCRNHKLLIDSKNQVQGVHTSRKLLTKFPNQEQVVESPNQAQVVESRNQGQVVESPNQVHHEVEGITLYFESPQNINQEESKSPKHELHFKDLHHPIGLHPHLPPFSGDGSGDDESCGTRKNPNYYKVCFDDGHCLWC